MQLRLPQAITTLQHSGQRRQPHHHQQLPHARVGVELSAWALYQPNRWTGYVTHVTSFNTSGERIRSTRPARTSRPNKAPAWRSAPSSTRPTSASPPGWRPSRHQSTGAQHRPLVHLVTLSGKRHRCRGRELDLTGCLTRQWRCSPPLADADRRHRRRRTGPGRRAQGSRPSLTPTFGGTFWSRTRSTRRKWRVGTGLPALRGKQTPCNRKPLAAESAGRPHRRT